MQKFKFSNNYHDNRIHTTSLRLTTKERWFLDQLRGHASYSDLFIKVAEFSLSWGTDAHKKFVAKFPDKDFDKLYAEFEKGK